ncbi:hypothetical protein BRD07_03740 [Halobacteriales archaeon QS_9_68_42]|nr:MAG: hypothetical protein BRC84_04870 [Halobacteriales archaeon QS_1_68_44]PSQ42311.1 MAG: hypothetical protein BRD07_03740 [Halobacteriales archaeon QS_9_68_42]
MVQGRRAQPRVGVRRAPEFRLERALFENSSRPDSRSAGGPAAPPSQFSVAVRRLRYWLVLEAAAVAFMNGGPSPFDIDERDDVGRLLAGVDRLVRLADE